MRRAWTKSSRCASLACCLAALAIARGAAVLRAAQDPPHRENETLLAGLRPGRDTFSTAEKRFKTKYMTSDSDTGVKEWKDVCTGRAIKIELGAKSVIQSVTLTALSSNKGKCIDRHAEFLELKNWITGKGIFLGDPQDRVVELYGEPNSTGPSEKQGHALELMYYQFDWAGSEVPQVMEILCDRETGKVAEITLAFPSL